MPRPYVTIKGTQQRRRVLREIGREEPRREFHSGREVRKSLSHMFGFTPLVQLSGQERRLLKSFTKQTVTSHVDNLALSASDILSGKTVISEPQRPYRSPSPAEVRELFTNGLKFSRTRFNIGQLGSGSRGIKGYLSEGGCSILK